MSSSPEISVVESFGTTTRRVFLHSVTNPGTNEREDQLTVRDEAKVFSEAANADSKKAGGSAGSFSLWVKAVQGFHYIFLPEGYPHSVSEDYARYQVWDTLQALCSSVTGTLSTRAILQGVGVGDEAANLLSGTLSWVLRDGTGMVSRIAFASYIASDLDNDAKRWRLTADVTNDIGLLLEIMSSHLPRYYFIVVVCIASIFKAITGVAGGSSRASLTQHFATRGNTADVSAKDGSQETAVNLIGMFLGMAVAALVPADSFWETALVFGFFTVLHLLSNYLGVCSLVLHTFNRQRLDICLSYHRNKEGKKKVIPSPQQMRHEEGVLFTNSMIKSTNVTLGSSLADELRSIATPSIRREVMKQAMEHLSRHKYAVFRCNSADGSKSNFRVVFSSDVDTHAMLLGYFHATHHHLIIEEEGHKSKSTTSGVELLRLEADNSSTVASSFDAFVADASAVGWRFDKAQLRVYDWRVDGASLKKSL